MGEIQKTIELAGKLADISGAIIRQYFRQYNLPVETKETEISSLVTLADREAEDAMVDILLKEAPTDGIVREEGENIPSQNGRYWVLDPIDGTSAFVRGFPIFGTAIGLVDLESHLPLLGIVNQPILQERWIGIRAKTTRLNDRVIVNPYAQETDTKLEIACLASTTPLMFVTEQQKTVASRLQSLCKRTAFGGDCYNYMALASAWSGMPMVILEADMKYHDFCAIIPIVEGVGGKISDWRGNPLRSESTEVLAASNRSLWEKTLEIIASS